MELIDENENDADQFVGVRVSDYRVYDEPESAVSGLSLARTAFVIIVHRVHTQPCFHRSVPHEH